MTLAFDIHIGSCSHLVDIIDFDIIDYNSSEKSIVFTFFPYKSVRDQI